MKGARLGNANVRKFANRRSVHRVAIQKLDLNQHAVVDERVHVIVYLWGTENRPRFCSTQSQLVQSELFSYCPIRIHLKPASNMRVHQRRFHGKYGSRGKSELIPNPSWIWEERLGGTCEGTSRFPSLAHTEKGLAKTTSASPKPRSKDRFDRLRRDCDKTDELSVISQILRCIGIPV